MRLVLFAALGVLLGGTASTSGIQPLSGSTSSAAGLDHIPIAVRDLERAADRYRALGFALKPGRPHANGIRNVHAKFPDGTELELITAPAARDQLTTTYRRHLADGDGPAFLAFHAPSLAAEARGSAPSFIFFGGLNHSLTDRSEHFAHPNGAESLIGVWLAADDHSRERSLLHAMGARWKRRITHVPDEHTADVAMLAGGEVVLLPGSRQLVRGRPIVGATVRVKSVVSARKVVAPIAAASLRTASGPEWSSLFVPPALAHGFWLELREVR
jgi:catechol 2,3-dioxygenase-like lactoylglutathione lyase family enzyme